MPWHDDTPWARRKKKAAPLQGVEALAEIERKLRSGDIGMSDALRIAYMVGFNTTKERRKATR